MPTHDAHVIYLVADPRFFESFARYKVDTEEYHDVVVNLLPPNWRIDRSTDVWFHCAPPIAPEPAQGWKIHLSATAGCARQLLCAVVPLLAELEVPFKFGLDQTILYLMTGKNWPREASGKFVTVYPSGDSQFLQLLERLHDATRDFEGPYVLSDRRFRDSKVVFYRYGVIRGQFTATPDGQRRGYLVDPHGNQVPDERVPYFVLPSWKTDPVRTPTTDNSSVDEPADEPGLLLDSGRFQIEKALVFKNGGGVYEALDRTTGETVVIKEARPRVAMGEHGRVDQGRC